MGDWVSAHLLNAAARAFVPIRAAMTGRGTGSLDHEASLLAIDNLSLHVSCVKQAEDGSGLIVRLFNPTAAPQPLTITCGRPVKSAVQCRMDESEVGELTVEGNQVKHVLEPKKIRTIKIGMKR